MIANAVTAFLDDRVGTGDGGSPAVVTADTTTTYAEVLALATRAGQGLRALGVEPEQRVAVLLPDGLAWVATFFGALRIGAIAVPFNTRLSAAEWTDMLRDSRARVLVADAALACVVAGHHAELPHLRAIVDFTELVAGANDGLSPEPVGLDAMAFWLYTSGTTGAAKAAVHLHRDLLAGRPYGCDVLGARSEEHTSELQSRLHLVCRLLLEKKKHENNRDQVDLQEQPSFLRDDRHRDPSDRQGHKDARAPAAEV